MHQSVRGLNMVNKRLWYEPSVVRFSKVKLPVVMLLIAFIFGRHFARSSHFFSLYKAAVSEGVLSRFGGSLDGRSAHDGSRKRRRLENGMEWGYEDRFIAQPMTFDNRLAYRSQNGAWVR